MLSHQANFYLWFLQRTALADRFYDVLTSFLVSIPSDFSPASLAIEEILERFSNIGYIAYRNN